MFLQLAALKRDDRFVDSSSTFQTSSAEQYHKTLQDTYSAPEPCRQKNESHSIPPLEIGSPIQSGTLYGTIKWIGMLPGSVALIAGVEMVLYFIA